MFASLLFRASFENTAQAIRRPLALAVCVGLLIVSGETRAAPPDFDKEIAPILTAKCQACHGEEKKESAFDVRSAAAILRGGDSGPAVVEGKADESLLIERIDAGEMPPEDAEPLTAEETALLRRWINEADLSAAKNSDDPWRRRLDEGTRFWSFQRPVRAPTPDVDEKHAGRAKNEIDAFILVTLDEAGLEPAPLADRRTLIRRAYFDLTGLPPSPEQVQAFVDDPSDDAWRKVVDELLASGHYGERWGRHWLDVARYADTGGYETDIYFKNAWRYRDYVVRSFNEDKPYNKFVQEQVAGDEIWPDNLDLHGSYVMEQDKLNHLQAHIGTGFYALGTQIHESNMDAGKRRSEELTDWVDTTGAAFMGLTLGCARCHDHKFDPISQRDYYSLQAIFSGSTVRDIPVVNAMEVADHKQVYPSLLALDEARKRYRLYEAQLAGRESTPAEKEELARLRGAVADAALGLPERAGSAPNTAWDGVLEIPTATVLRHEEPDLLKPVMLLSRGDLDRPKEKMNAALPELLAEQTERSPWLPEGVHRRKELALWLTRDDHPLTARVMANRIWGWHFGRGIVATPSDFGQMGQPPSHPQLLDWLALEFVERGWSVKEMHRLIMMSATYQQASDFHSERHETVDPDNKLCWRMERRRLEGEAIWDAIHSIAGTINLKQGGRPVMPPLAAEELTNKANWITNADPAEHTRRGIYIITRRNFQFPMFEVFDAPVNSMSCAARNVSTVAPQALWLLNNHEAFDQARRFAARLAREAGGEPDAQIQRAFQLALARSPSDSELSDARQLLDAFAASAAASSTDGMPAELAALGAERARALELYCLAMFNLNEFIFVD